MEAYEAFNMTQFEVLQTMDLNLSTALTLLQFWVTATFGLIVAYHFAGERLTRNLLIFASLLYLASSSVSLLGYLQSAWSAIYWSEASEIIAVKAGTMTEAQAMSSSLIRDIALMGGAVLVFVGSIATIYYGRHVRRVSAEAPPSRDPAKRPQRPRRIKRPRRRPLRPV